MEAIIGLVGVAVGGLVSLLTTLFLEYIRAQGEQKRLSSALFGELLSLERHDKLSAEELPDIASSAADLPRLQMALYGSLAFFKENVGRLGFLKDAHIKSLLQLSIQVRNDDINLNWAIDEVNATRPVDLQRIRARLRDTSNQAAELLKAIYKS